MRKQDKIYPDYSKYAELRDKKNVCDHQVMKETGIPTSCLTRWRQGKTFPKIDKLIVLADYFQVSIESLISERSPDEEEKEH